MNIRTTKKRYRFPLPILLAVAFSATPVSAANPYNLVADVQHPYLDSAFVVQGSPDPQEWCPVGHWTPWNGDWAFDVWKSSGTCYQDVYLRVTPGTMPGATRPDSLRAKVVNVSYHPYACASQDYWAGGYQQAFEIYATYQGVEYSIGWVLFAHLDNMVYNFGDWINDPTQVKIGTVFGGGYTGGCWGGCHIHMEFENYNNYSCHKELCPPYYGIPQSGSDSVVGKLGGSLSYVQDCPVSATANDAEIVAGSSTVPSFIYPGETRQAVIRVRNTGSTTWTAGTAYRLGADNGDGFRWTAFSCNGYSLNPGNSRAYLCHDVPPGGTHDFNFFVEYPDGAFSATVPLRVKMVRDGFEWFGQSYSWNVNVVGGSCSCSQGISYWGQNIPASDTFCSFTVCGLDNQLYECGFGGWSARGGTPCNCQCSGGFDYLGKAIDPDYTHCGFTVCGLDYQIYRCDAGGWTGTGVACP